MTDKEFNNLILFLLILILFFMALITIKICDTSDKLDRLGEQIKTEQILEQPTTTATTEPATEKQIEPGDDEIVIERGLEK